MTTTTNTTANTFRSLTMFTTRAFVTQSESGYLQTGHALLTNGYWAVRAGGTHIWATSPDRALALAGKVGGKVGTTPATFVEWGEVTRRAPLPAPGPFAQGGPASQAASQPTATPRTVPVQAAVPRPRSAAQCRATLALVARNAVRCERGEIGGDLAKARKGVLTALGNYEAACAAEGGAVDEGLVADALYAAGADLAAAEEA